MSPDFSVLPSSHMCQASLWANSIIFYDTGGRWQCPNGVALWRSSGWRTIGMNTAAGGSHVAAGGLAPWGSYRSASTTPGSILSAASAAAGVHDTKCIEQQGLPSLWLTLLHI
eukprot:scaffold9632_cov46-Prasinocladus_malaysianus.AAC.1